MIGGLITGFATSPWTPAALRCRITALANLLFQLALRRSAERASGLAERLETMEKIRFEHVGHRLGSGIVPTPARLGHR